MNTFTNTSKDDLRAQADLPIDDTAGLAEQKGYEEEVSMDSPPPAAVSIRSLNAFVSPSPSPALDGSDSETSTEDESIEIQSATSEACDSDTVARIDSGASSSKAGRDSSNETEDGRSPMARQATKNLLEMERLKQSRTNSDSPWIAKARERLAKSKQQRQQSTLFPRVPTGTSSAKPIVQEATDMDTSEQSEDNSHSSGSDWL